MFYCEPCALNAQIKLPFYQTYGSCDLCGEHKILYDHSKVYDLGPEAPVLLIEQNKYKRPRRKSNKKGRPNGSLRKYPYCRIFKTKKRKKPKHERQTKNPSYICYK